MYRHGYFVWRGTSRGPRARRPQLGGRARLFVHTRLYRGVYSGHRAHRRGLVQLGLLVGHLDRSGLFGGGSTVGACGAEAGSTCVQGHRRLGAIVCPPSFGVGRCIAVQESVARPRSRPGGPVRRLGGEAVGSAARGAAQVSRARGRRAEPGGSGQPGLWVRLTPRWLL